MLRKMQNVWLAISIFLLVMTAWQGSLKPVEAVQRGDEESAHEQQDEAYVPGEVLVLVSADVDRNGMIEAGEKLDGVEAAVQGTVVRHTSLSRGRQVLRVRLPMGKPVREALRDNWGSRDSRILVVEPNYKVQIAAGVDDPRFSELWGLDNTGQTGGTPDADIDAPEAWDLNTGSSDVIVAVIDTGIDYSHPDLVDNMWVNSGEIADNGIDDDGNGYVDDVYGYDFYQDDGDPSDAHSHGTHCAGTIAARGDNSIGVTGVNWRCRLMACRFLNAGGSGSTADAIDAINYAVANGADVLSNSWGGGSYSASLEAAIENARDQGVLFVVAAGNYSRDIDPEPYYPASYEVSNVISVAATDDTDALASFSNYGVQSAYLGAPGVSVLSSIPEYQTVFFEDFEDANTPGFVGTQMSTEGPANQWGTIDSDIGTDNIAARGDWANFSPYLGGSDGVIVTPPIDTRGLRGLTIEFNYRYEIDPTDEFTMDVWDGASWHTLFSRNRIGYFRDYYWSTRIDIPDSYRNEQMKVRFRWVSDANDNDYYGAEIDNISLKCIADGNEAYGSKSGTSMATPHVAGVAALLLADDPTMSLQELKSRIVWTGDPIPALDGKTVSGMRLNAYNALTVGPELRVYSPNGGETWRPGTESLITWMSIGGSATADIYLLKDGTTHSQIADDISNDGMFIWYVPNDLPIDSDYCIQVDDGVRIDVSDSNFSIVESVIRYVDANAPGANNGTSWLDAYNYLQDALTDATSNSDIGKILVAEGIYTPDSSSAEPEGSGEREATFQLINGVALEGGYAGFGEPDPNARDIELYETILSGDIDGNDVDVNDPCDLLIEPTRGENSYHIVTASGTDQTAVLDGLTITGGNAEGAKPYGGGMYNYKGSPTVTNCTFSGNSAKYFGGGMYNYSSSPTVTGCTFIENSTDDYGGGIYCYYYSSVTLTDCTFTGNSASYYGGGMYAYYDSDVTLTNCMFMANWARYGGAMHNYSSTPTVTNCTFMENSAVYSGGGMYNSYSDSLILTGCTFNGNSASYGGAMYNLRGSVSTVTNCIFLTNLANYGGALYNYDFGSLTVTNCAFSGNSADVYGGGIYDVNSPLTLTNCLLVGNSADYYGGAMHNRDSSPTVTGCTFSANSAARYGGAVYNYDSNPDIANCILWDNSAPSGGAQIYDSGSSSASVIYSDMQGGWSGVGNINEDPCFVEPGHWADVNDPNIPVEPDDPNAMWVDGDYHLPTGSPCIDAGDNSSVPADGNDIDGDGNTVEPMPWDLDGSPRFADGDCNGSVVVDMGAYESEYPVSTAAIYRFRTPRTFFWTIDEEQKNWIIDNMSHIYTYQDIAWYAYPPDSQPPQAEPVYRFHSPVLKTLFWTINEAERDHVINNLSHLFNYEGIDWYAYPEGSQSPLAKPVYRFRSFKLKMFFWTIDEAEKNRIIENLSHLFRYEGIAWYAYEHPEPLTQPDSAKRDIADGRSGCATSTIAPNSCWD